VKNRIRRLKLKLAIWLLGGIPKSIDEEVESLYQDIWPKHDFYNEANKQLIRSTLLSYNAATELALRKEAATAVLLERIEELKEQIKKDQTQ